MGSISLDEAGFGSWAGFLTVIIYLLIGGFILLAGIALAAIFRKDNKGPDALALERKAIKDEACCFYESLSKRAQKRLMTAPDSRREKAVVEEITRFRKLNRVSAESYKYLDDVFFITKVASIAQKKGQLEAENEEEVTVGHLGIDTLTQYFTGPVPTNPTKLAV